MVQSKAAERASGMSSNYRGHPRTGIGVRLLAGAGLLAMLLSLTLARPCAASSPDRPRRVLVIPSYNFNYQGSQRFLQGVMAEFTDHTPFQVAFFHENLQLAIRPLNQHYQKTMAASLKIKYSLEKPDLIIVQYKQALQFMLRYGREIFGDVPVVFAGLGLENYGQVKFPVGYTGVIASFSPKYNIELILRNHPGVKRIYVVGGSTPMEQDLVNRAITEGEAYRGRIEFVNLSNLTFAALLAKLERVQEHSAVMYQVLQLDAEGKVFVPASAAREIARSAHAPVYGMLDTYLGSGIAGGFLIHNDGLGRRAAQIGVEILQGKRAPGIPYTVEPIGAYRFDGRQLKRWGIDEGKLPIGSQIDFPEPTLWDSHRWEIIGATGLVLLQALLIAGLLTNRLRRRKAEREIAVLAEIGRVIGSTLDIEEVYDRFAAETAKLIPFDSLIVNLKKSQEEMLEVTYVSGLDIPERRVGKSFPLQGSFSELIMRTRKGMIVQSGHDGAMIAQFPSLIVSIQAGIHSFMSVPLISQDNLIGTLMIRSKRPNAYTEQDLRLANGVGMQIAGAISNARLFADLKETENSLRESEERFRLAYYTGPDAININRLSDGMFVDINEGFSRLTGLTREDVIGKISLNPSIWCHPADRQKLFQELAKNGYCENLEADFRRKDGMISTGLMSARIIELQGVPHIISITRDIGDRKRFEREQKLLGERLQRAEKMEALGQLAGGVAHDLNNVLGVLVGYAELLQEKISEDDPRKRYTDHILRSSIKGAAIIQDLLTLARRGVAVSEVVCLNRVVSDYWGSPEFESLKVYHPYVTFRTDLEKDLLNIHGSPVHLGKTVMNLVSNATEAISDRGEVTIRTENSHLDRPMLGYDNMREGDYVILSVTDTGEGISPTDLGKIFEPFYTKKVMGRSGTGLGLAVVWGTVKDHNGYIDVQSERGKGSTFSLYFPATREEELAIDRQAVSADLTMGQGESILVVDDVQEQRELAVSMLARLGYQAGAASSGEEALNYLKTNKADLIVLDMIMDPGMDGLETYRKVLDSIPGQKAVIVSGFSETDRVRKAQELGAGAYVRKPYIMEKIGVAIRQELDKK